ncbi:MAG TPA: AraC family transcriptional regulator [Puia sp.]|uniref:helix-turn-helix domain-containing protein n=1 Tax=Puia sp. TaxID=2045100 RepID=UPI002BB50F44|nr:AraC family transcriptional regulator [Puia sp.]HVU93708.1 AraC family transcriptional regulator [Puia sp.]
MRHTKSPYTSSFFTWEGVSAVFYSSCLTPFHRHTALQLILDTQQCFRFRTRDSGWSTYRSLLIREKVVHQLDTNNSVQLMIYVKAETGTAEALQDILGTGNIYAPEVNIFHFAHPDQLQRALLQGDAALVESLIRRVLTYLIRNTGVVKPDERVLRVEQRISAMPPTEVNMRSLAAEVCLSESRLRSLFRNTTGIPLYRYILWNKIRFATNRIMAGDTVSDAAMEAGFTDSSHFHKMMVQVFGVSPSQFLKENLANDFIVCEKVK